MKADNRTGEFLRARRERVRPEQVGLPDFGRRRAPGLRRGELATLAGVSVDYYVRLEQGRDRHPSEQVLDALARALRLDDDASAHLQELARPTPRRLSGPARPERVLPELQRLLDTWAHTPAFVLGRRMDVMAANTLAGVVHGAYTRGQNVLRHLFLDPSARAFYAEWDDVALDAVAALRRSVGPDIDDPRLTELVGELSLKSEEFGRLWARHDARAKTHGVKRLNHGLVGELVLSYVTFSVAGAPGQTLLVHHAAPGSASEQALALLSTIG